MKGTTALFVFNIILVLLSMLTCFKVAPGPDIVGVALAFYCLFILPGFLICALCKDSIEGIVESISISFFTGLVFVSALALLGFIPGMSYTAICITGAAADIVLLVFVHRRSGSRGERTFLELLRIRLPARRAGGQRRTGRYLLAVVLFAACFVFFHGNGDLSIESDSPDHLSFVRRSIDSGRIFPQDSFYKEGDGAAFDARKGLWHPVLSLWVFQSETTPEYLWRMLPAFLAFFALVVFFYFARRLLGSDSYAALALVCLLLFFRGEGVRWLSKLSFSRSMAQLVLWAGAAMLFRYYGKGAGRLLVFVGLAVLMGISFHLVFALWIATMMAALFVYVTFVERSAVLRRRFWTSAAVAAVAAVPPLAVRAAFTVAPMNEIHTHLQGMLLLSDRLRIVDPAEILSRFGLVFFFALVLVPFLFLILPRSRGRDLTAVLFIVPAVLVLDPMTALPLEERLGYLHYRMLYAAPMMCLLALVIAGLARVIARGRTTGSRNAGSPEGGDRTTGGSARAAGKYAEVGKRRAFGRRIFDIAGRLTAAAALLVILWYPGLYSLNALKEYIHANLYGSAEVDERCGRLFGILERSVPARSVVVSDPRTSYIISAFTDHFVAVTLDQHCSPTDTSAIRRIEGVRDLFNPAVPLAGSIPFLREVDAGYVLMNTGDFRRSRFFLDEEPGEDDLILEKLRAAEPLLHEIAGAAGFYLFELARDSLSVDAPLGSTGAFAGPLNCDDADSPGGNIAVEPAMAFDGGVVLEKITIERGEIERGSVLRGSLCWRLERAVPFWFPFEWTIRLDTDYPKGSYYRAWYGKQYRRLIERRNGELYRLTRTHPMRSGYAPPEQWPPGVSFRQDFELDVPRFMAPGEYTVHLSVRRPAFLDNRTIGDYLRDKDSFHGEIVARIRITGAER